MDRNGRKDRNWFGQNKANKQCCGRSPSAKELALADAGFDGAERAVLNVARHFWQTFAVPESQAWLSAMQIAQDASVNDTSGEFGLEVLAAVQSMRMSRSSCFCFSSPGCPGCSAIVSEHERQFMSVLRAVREGRNGVAQTHAMILCEGNDTAAFLARMCGLAMILPPLKTSSAATNHAASMV